VLLRRGSEWPLYVFRHVALSFAGRIAWEKTVWTDSGGAGGSFSVFGCEVAAFDITMVFLTFFRGRGDNHARHAFRPLKLERTASGGTAAA
jgi:hypothetical protein